MSLFTYSILSSTGIRNASNINEALTKSAVTPVSLAGGTIPGGTVTSGGVSVYGGDGATITGGLTVKGNSYSDVYLDTVDINGSLTCVDCRETILDRVTCTGLAQLTAHANISRCVLPSGVGSTDMRKEHNLTIKDSSTGLLVAGPLLPPNTVMRFPISSVVSVVDNVTITNANYSWFGPYIYGAGSAIPNTPTMVVQSLDVRASRVGYSGTIPYGVLGGHARKYAWLDIGQVYAEVTDCTFDRLLIGWAEQNSKTTIDGVTAVVTGGTIPAIYLGGAHGTSASVNVGSVTATVRNTTFDELHLCGRSQYATIDGDVTCVLAGDEVMVSATVVLGAQRGESWPVVNGNIKLIVDCNSEFRYVQYIDALQINAGNTLTVTTNLIPRIRDNGESKLTLDLHLPEDSQLNDEPWTVLAGAGLSDTVVRGSEIKLNGQDVELDTILRDDTSFGVYYSSADKRLEWRKPWSLEETVFDVTATADSPTHNMFLMGTTTVDWGDGSSSTTSSSPGAAQNADVLLQHTYASPGTYTVRIKGSNYRLTHSNGQGGLDPGARIVTRIRQIGNVLYSASGMWGYCKQLAVIDEGATLQTITTNNMTSMFVNSRSDAIPFPFPASFKIPDGVTDLSHSFYNMGCVDVPFLIPEIVTNMHNTFSYAGLLRSIPADFKFPAGVTSLRGVFNGCGQLSADISNIFPEEWKNGGYTCDLQGAFGSSPNITGTVPSWLFDGRNNFTFNATTFAYCEKLTNYNEIPASWGGGGCGYLSDMEYTEVEYLETVSGVSQWLDTGVAFDPTQDWLIEAESEALTGYRSSICGSYMDSEHYCITLEWYTSRIARAYLIPSSGVPVDLKGASLSGKQKLTLSYSASQKTLTLTAGGKQYTSQFTVGSAPDSPNLRIFSDHRSNPDALANPSRLYSLRITRAGTVVRDFSPVVSTGGMPYLRDSVTGRFYYNQGSGKFIYG